MAYLLQHLLAEAAQRGESSPAVDSPGCTLTYGELDRLSGAMARALARLGVAAGDRVGVLAPKSAAAAVAVYGALRAGACYVPLDPKAPAERLAYIARDAGLSVILADEATAARAAALARDLPGPGAVVVAGPPGADSRPADAAPHAGESASGVAVVPWREVEAERGPAPPERAIETDLAYILYTSGSTGAPKGVMISHRNSLTFVEWAAAAAGLGAADRVTSPAPLHFDLSVFDVFASCRAGACLVTLPEGAATFPVRIAEWLEQERISVWYSVPSLLTLLACYGDLPRFDLSRLRAVIFAGEVFPAKHLARLMSELPHPRYLNWYGPTETNVCTAFEVPRGWSGAEPLPIGKACANTEVFALTADGRRVSEPGEEGELLVRGPSLMAGYRGQPERTREVLVRGPAPDGREELLYRTGDLVTLDADGNYVYLGRRDAMVKIRGYRVELGEVEAALYRHPAVKEAAVLPSPDDLLGARLRAVVAVAGDGADPGGAATVRAELLEHCRRWLPGYMVPDLVEFREALPRTSTGKIDRVSLARRDEPAPAVSGQAR